VIAQAEAQRVQQEQDIQKKEQRAAFKKIEIQRLEEQKKQRAQL